MRGTLFDHDSLLDEYSQRLHDEQEAQAKARFRPARAEEAQRAAERKLEISLETARRRAEDDHARLVKVEEELRDTAVERDRAAAELRVITEGDGELVRLRAEAAAAHEDMTRSLADLDVQAARADTAEAELATARQTSSQAERLIAEADEARDLAGIDLETTRRELAERNELLDAERTESQTRSPTSTPSSRPRRGPPRARPNGSPISKRNSPPRWRRETTPRRTPPSRPSSSNTPPPTSTSFASTRSRSVTSSRLRTPRWSRATSSTRRPVASSSAPVAISSAPDRDADEAKRAVGSQPVLDEEAPVEVDPIVVKPLVAEVEPELEVEPVAAHAG